LCLVEECAAADARLVCLDVTVEGGVDDLCVVIREDGDAGTAAAGFGSKRVESDEAVFDDELASVHIDCAAVFRSDAVGDRTVAENEFAGGLNGDCAAVCRRAAGERDAFDRDACLDAEDLSVGDVVAVGVAADRQQVCAGALDDEIAKQRGRAGARHADRGGVGGQGEGDGVVVAGLGERVGEGAGLAVVECARHQMVARGQLDLDREGAGGGEQRAIARAERERRATGVVHREQVARIEDVGEVRQRAEDLVGRARHRVFAWGFEGEAAEVVERALGGLVDFDPEGHGRGVVAGEPEVGERPDGRHRRDDHRLLRDGRDVQDLRGVVDAGDADREVVVLRRGAGGVGDREDDDRRGGNFRRDGAARRRERDGAQGGDEVACRLQRERGLGERAEAGGREGERGAELLQAAHVGIRDEDGGEEDEGDVGIRLFKRRDGNAGDRRRRLGLHDCEPVGGDVHAPMPVGQLEAEGDLLGGGRHDVGVGCEFEIGDQRPQVDEGPAEQIRVAERAQPGLRGVRERRGERELGIAVVQIRDAVEDERPDRLALRDRVHRHAH